MRRVEHGLREFLSSWQVWMILAYAVLAAVSIGLVVVSGRQAREAAAAAARVSAASSTQVGQCFVAVRNAPVTRGFLDAHDALVTNGILSAKAAIAAETAGDPLRSSRLQALGRLQKAKDNSAKLRDLIARMTPTRAKCIALAARLNVDASRYITPAARGHSGRGPSRSRPRSTRAARLPVRSRRL